jgi:hypothetical protein
MVWEEAGKDQSKSPPLGKTPTWCQSLIKRGGPGKPPLRLIWDKFAIMPLKETIWLQKEEDYHEESTKDYRGPTGNLVFFKPNG